MIALAVALTLLQPAAQAPPDVDLLPPEAAPDPGAQAREQDLSRRRTLLDVHQLGGMLTLASLGATVIFGELNYLDKYGGRGDTGRWYEWHRASAITASALFAGTAALALLAPAAPEKRTRLDTVTLHKVAMATASAGMVAQIALGIWTASKEGSTSQRGLAQAHQIVGFATFLAAAAGFGVLLF